MFLTEDELMVG